MTDRAFLGVDVGTGSVRAGIFDGSGALLGVGKHDIALHRGSGGIAEQSADEIWRAVCGATRDALSISGLASDAIVGIGFDATCSLAVIGADGAPLAVNPEGDADRSVIVWMDHRATDQAARINATGHEVLRYVGGRISPEMQTPKLLWLKEHLPETYEAAAHFFDLADYLTWRATGSTARSACTVTCKWTYLRHESRWDAGYFREIGLGDIAKDGFVRIGSQIADPGTAIGGLTGAAAADLGLSEGTPVAASLIDAHAGGLGTVGGEGGIGGPETRMAYVMGTSACTMSSTADPAFVPGVWGPYFSAMLPGLWLNEGGQSAAGAAIDHLLGLHPAAAEAADRAAAAGQTLPAWLADEAATRVDTLSDAVRLAGPVVVVPDFLGNRAPYADPDARGVISGLDLDTGLDSLVALYVAGICGLGHGLRQILDVQAAEGVSTEAIVISGGAGASPLVRQLLADTTGIPVLVPATPEPVLLGAAMLGAAAAGCSLTEAMTTMSAFSDTITPATGPLAELHRTRHTTFEALQAATRL